MISQRRHRAVVLGIDALLVVMGVLGAYRVAVRAGVPAYLSVDRGRVYVRDLEAGIPYTPLLQGDTIRAINGQEVSSLQGMEFLTDHFQIGDTVALDVERAGQAMTLSVTLGRYYGLRYLLIQCLVGGLYFFLGVLAFVKRPGDKAALVFHWLSVAVGVMIMSTWASYAILPRGLGSASQVLDLLANAAIPVLLVHFSCVFPREKPRGERFIPALYLIAGGFFLWMTIAFLRALAPPSSADFQRFLQAFNTFRWFFSLSILVGVVNLLHSFFTSREGEERRKLRWVILGMGVGPLCFVVLWVIPYIVLARSLVDPDIIVLISAIAPATFAISIIRYHIMDIDLIFNRGTVYTVLLGVLLTIYALVVGTAAILAGTLTVRASLIASGVAATVVALLFEPTRRFVQNVVDRTFFRVRYDYRIVQRRITDDIMQCADVQQLADLIVRRTDEILQLERIGFFRIEEPGGRIILLAHRNGGLFGAPGVSESVTRLHPGARLPLALEYKVEAGAVFEAADPELFRELGLALVLALCSEGMQTLGLLVLGLKRSGTRFSIEDLDLLNSVATQAGLAMDRITLQEKLVMERAETQRLEELNRLKSYFVSSVSHELKTPLTSIKMFAELLRSKKKPGARQSQEYLEIIEGESERLSMLIENVLDFAQVERGVKEYHLTDVSLKELVEKVLRSMRYQFRMQGFRVEMEISPEDHLIHADPAAVIEALTNLLSNAMKYSRDKKAVRIATFDRDGFAAVAVEDKGIGISEKELSHIFDAFYRTQEGGAQRSAGAGLGLALVRHVMDAHGGKVEVRSEPGRGSTFTLLFPMEGG
ncbi:MAG: PDZ domain-containing protein [Fidelibacterota bacterium]|nr:MAG: PDZ domain-containing protein [Candidatus Neomarinimicrobiota bacterium]